VALRKGSWKYIRCALDPELLFDLGTDPAERVNRAGDPAARAILDEMRSMADARWDLAAYDADVRASQARRWVVYEALRNGSYFPWDYQPLQKASERYMRNHMDLNILEESKRFPRGE
ncbi:MAG: choline-sulfatase, partial [Aestuariivirga sp.]